MSVFQYQGWRNPYVNSISALMERQGEIPAQAAERAAAAQAQARLTSGQAWAGAAQGVGNAVSGAIQQATDPRRKMEAAQAMLAQGQVADQAATRAGQGQVDRIMSASPLAAGQEGPQQESFLTPDGLFDIPKMNASLAKSGSAHLAPELLSGAERINAAIQKSQEHDQVAAQQKTLLYGDLADGVLKLAKTGMPITAAMDFVVAPALATKRLQPQEYAQIKQQIGAMPPEQQAAALTSLMDAAEKLDKGDTLSEGAIHVGRYGRTEAANPKVERRPDYTINGQRFNGTTNQPIGDQVAPIAAPAAAQTHTMRLKGVGDVPVDYVPNKDGSGGKWMYLGKDVTGDLTAIPSAAITIHNQNQQAPTLPSWATDDSRPAGPDANKLDPSTRMTPNGLFQAAMTKISTGQYPQTGRGSDPASQATRAAINAKVGAIAAASGMDEPALRAFYKSNAASLVQQQKMYDAVQGFMATADKNADLLSKTLEKLPDIGSPIFNKPYRAFEKDVAGDTNLSQFATYIKSVQNEYGRIISQPNLAGQLTDSARHEASVLIDPNSTVPQILASITALRNEGDNRLVSVGEQIQRIQKRLQNPGAAASPSTPTPLTPTMRYNPATGKAEAIKKP